MSEQQSIKDTLNVIKKALEDDESILEENDSNILILNKLVKDDGTIHVLENKFLEKEEVKEILNQKFPSTIYTFPYLDDSSPLCLNELLAENKFCKRS